MKFLALDAHGIQMSILPQIKVLAVTLSCDDSAEGLPYDPASQVTQVLHQLRATGTSTGVLLCLS